MDWGDVLDGALSFFLIVCGVGIGYVCLRLGGVLGRTSTSVRELTDEVVPILTRAQTTVDGINLELSRVDEIMVTAVNATKGAEKTVGTIQKTVSAPARKASGVAAALKEAAATFRARRQAERVEIEEPAPPPPAVGAPAAYEAGAPGPNGTAEAAEQAAAPGRGPSLSQIAWALPKGRPGAD
jgi:hypothetical protein